MGGRERVLTLPNVLSLLRLAMIPLILRFMYERDLDWALILFIAAGITDTLDGLLARVLDQKTVLGMYLDPIADKLLMSSSFLVLAITGEVAWPITALVLARDVLILAAVGILMLTTDLRRFPPTMLGKINTTVQVGAIFAVLLDAVYGGRPLRLMRLALLGATAVLVFATGVQYAVRTRRELRMRKAAVAAGRRP